MFIVETKDIPLRTLLYVLLILIIFIVNIFVAKLSSTTTSEDLQALFSEHGSVSSAKVIMDKETGNSKCFGFVEMEDETEGFNAINALNETEFQGRKSLWKRLDPEKKVATTEVKDSQEKEDLIRIVKNEKTESLKKLSVFFVSFPVLRFQISV